MQGKGSCRRLYSYVGREYVFSFLVAFVFFFFIFFVNQILVLAQKILLKNVEVGDVLYLVVLSIPQFLIYTMPFSSLASASMVIGSLSSQNEILAMRSCGVHIGRVFTPIIAISLLFSVCTFFIADSMIPYTAQQYRDLYGSLLQKLPTMQIESYSATRFGSRVLSNGIVEGNNLNDIILFDDSDPSQSRVITSPRGTINVVDLDRCIYKIDLEDCRVLVSNEESTQSFGLAEASSVTIFLDFSDSVSTYLTVSPSQMSIDELKQAISSKKTEQEENDKRYKNNTTMAWQRLGDQLMSLEESPERIIGQADNAVRTEKNHGVSFYYQYYRSEVNKKLALSIACTILVFITFPISFFRVKYGRLIGFGISMFVACAYWFMLFYSQVISISTTNNPAWYVWTPNLIFFVVGIILLIKMRKQ